MPVITRRGSEQLPSSREFTGRDQARLPTSCVSCVMFRLSVPVGSRARERVQVVFLPVLLAHRSWKSLVSSTATAAAALAGGGG